MNINSHATTGLRFARYVLLIAAALPTGLTSRVLADEDQEAHHGIAFSYHAITGLGPEEGVMRRDPSDIIKVGDLYYIWYTKGDEFHGWNGTVWYAVSPDGWNWEERGEAVARGPGERWDSLGVFTPNILVANDRYWLFFDATPKGFGEWTKTAIGLAVADHPDGPWTKRDEPILVTDTDTNAFDSIRVDDTCFVVRDGRYFMYYKGKQWGRSWRETKQGLAIAEDPGGPYKKVEENPVIPAGHEVMVWPYGDGVMSLINIGPEPYWESLQYSDDGIHFRKIADTGRVPGAAGFYRPEAFTGSGNGGMPEWGIHIGYTESFLPHLERVNCQWPDPQTLVNP